MRTIDCESNNPRGREYGRWASGRREGPHRQVNTLVQAAGRKICEKMLSKGPPLFLCASHDRTCPGRLSAASGLLSSDSIMAQWQIVIVSLLLCARTGPRVTLRHALTALYKPGSLLFISLFSDAHTEALTDLLGKICMCHVTGPDMFGAQSSTTACVIPSKASSREPGSAVHRACLIVASSL